jgi:RluA family pseudouridine synthase
MMVLKTHIVHALEDEIRFVDYIIGVFQGFETKNAVKTGIKKHRFVINGKDATTGIWMKTGDVVELLERSEKPKAYDKKIEIVFEDNYLAVVNKPAGLPVSGNQFKTLENCLVDQLTLSSAEDALGWALPIHRLDAPTSGLVVFAKTISARRKLGEMLEQKSINKHYHAILHGIPAEGRINSPIDSKEAISELAVVRSVGSPKNGHLSLVRLTPITGRTHQLRIHCLSIGNAIAGDKKHTNENGSFRNKGLFLAATELEFEHPMSGESLRIQIPLPNKFTSLLERESKRAERLL